MSRTYQLILLILTVGNEKSMGSPVPTCGTSSSVPLLTYRTCECTCCSQGSTKFIRKHRPCGMLTTSCIRDVVNGNAPESIGSDTGVVTGIPCDCRCVLSLPPCHCFCSSSFLFFFWWVLGLVSLGLQLIHFYTYRGGSNDLSIFTYPSPRPLPMNVFFVNSNIGTWDNRVVVWSGMGGKLDFYKTPTEQRNVFSKLRFSEKKDFRITTPKTSEDLSKSSKTTMTGGMSTVTGITYAVMGQQCISRWWSTEKLSCWWSSGDYAMFGGGSSPIPS